DLLDRTQASIGILQVATSEAMVQSYASSLANVAIYAELHGYVALMRIFNPGELSDFPASTDRDPQISSGNLFAKVIAMREILSLPFSSGTAASTMVAAGGQENSFDAHLPRRPRGRSLTGHFKISDLIKRSAAAIYPTLQHSEDKYEPDPATSSVTSTYDDQLYDIPMQMPREQRETLKLHNANVTARRHARQERERNLTSKSPVPSSMPSHVAIHHPTAPTGRSTSPPPPADTSNDPPATHRGLFSFLTGSRTSAFLSQPSSSAGPNARKSPDPVGSSPSSKYATSLVPTLLASSGSSSQLGSDQAFTANDEWTTDMSSARPDLQPLNAVLYLDLDAWIQINKHAHTPLEGFLPPDAHISLQASSDLCSCVFMARSSAWTQRFLSRWADLGKRGCCPEHPYDQLALHTTLLEHASPESGLRKHAAYCLPVPRAADVRSTGDLLPLDDQPLFGDTERDGSNAPANAELRDTSTNPRNMSLAVGRGGGVSLTHLADNYTWNTLGRLRPLAVGVDPHLLVGHALRGLLEHSSTAPGRKSIENPIPGRMLLSSRPHDAAAGSVAGHRQAHAVELSSR
ncbi:hypothetical protein WJX84_003979, partial [Apatococcus fuscideae]